MAWDTKVESAIGNAAQRFGVDPRLLKTFARIESGGRPNARTGSYKGLFQLSDREFGKYGGGNIYDPEANASAAAQKLARESAAFKAKYGRDPAPNDLYMIHQQGEGGYAAHSANPDAPAWQNMYSTAEGRQKGPGWAKQAIWGNVPSDVRAQYPGGVDSLTSKQFMDLWAQKVARMGGDAPASSHMAANAVNQVANGAPQTMAGPIGGAPIAGGPVPLTPPNMRYSKLADALMAQAAGADIKGWGDALRSLGGAALGYSLANKADTQQGEYKSKLAQALGAAKDPEALTQTLLSSGDSDLVKQGVAMQINAQKAKQPPTGRDRFLSTPNGIMDLTTMQMVPGTSKGQSDKPIEIGGRLVRPNPETGKYEEVYATPPAPPKLEVADRKEIFEADEGAQAAGNVMSSLDKALTLNDKAYSGIGAQTRGYLGSLVGQEGGVATEELQNVVLQQVLDNLKATFGAAPTEGERQILVDIQGSVSKSPEVRRKIFEAAKGAAEKRMRFNQERAGALRSGGYYKPGYSPSTPPAATPQVAPPAAPAPQMAPPQAAAPKAAPPAAIEMLKANPSPDMRRYFDETFGPGASERALGAAMAQPQPPMQDLSSPYGIAP